MPSLRITRRLLYSWKNEHRPSAKFKATKVKWSDRKGAKKLRKETKYISEWDFAHEFISHSERNERFDTDEILEYFVRAARDSCGTRFDLLSLVLSSDVYIFLDLFNNIMCAVRIEDWTPRSPNLNSERWTVYLFISAHKSVLFI